MAGASSNCRIRFFWGGPADEIFVASHDEGNIQVRCGTVDGSFEIRRENQLIW